MLNLSSALVQTLCGLDCCQEKSRVWAGEILSILERFTQGLGQLFLLLNAIKYRE